MSSSSPYTPPSGAQANKSRSQVVLTDTVTGEVVLATKIVDEDSNTVQYLDATGGLLNGTGNLGVNQVADTKARSIVLGSATIADVAGVAKSFASESITVPANTGFAYAEVKDAAVIYTIDGTDPDATAGAEVGIRVNDGGRIELDGSDSVNKFKVIVYGAGTPDLYFEFKNVEGESTD